jgi:hypothetical protein
MSSSAGLVSFKTKWCCVKLICNVVSGFELCECFNPFPYNWWMLEDCYIWTTILRDCFRLIVSLFLNIDIFSRQAIKLHLYLFKYSSLQASTNCKEKGWNIHTALPLKKIRLIRSLKKSRILGATLHDVWN